jgi:hypothetical protein
MFINYMTGGWASLFIQITCLLLAVQYTIYKPAERPYLVGCLLMEAANFFGQLVMAHEGPIFFVGIFVFPLYGALAVLITKEIRNGRFFKVPLLAKRTQKPIDGPKG